MLITAVVYFIITGVTLGVLGPSAMGKNDTPLFLGAKKATAGARIVLSINGAEQPAVISEDEKIIVLTVVTYLTAILIVRSS